MLWCLALSVIILTYGLKFDLDISFSEDDVEEIDMFGGGMSVHVNTDNWSTSARWLFASGSSVGLDFLVTEPLILVCNALLIVLLGEMLGDCAVKLLATCA